jgi:hypothetical protein
LVCYSLQLQHFQSSSRRANRLQALSELDKHDNAGALNSKGKEKTQRQFTILYHKPSNANISFILLKTYYQQTKRIIVCQFNR